MKPGQDPLRLLDPRSNVSEDVRKAVSAGRAELPDPEALARIAAKLPPAFGQGSSGLSGERPCPPKLHPPLPAAAPSIVPSIVPSALLGGALGALVSGAVALWTPSPAAPPPTATVSAASMQTAALKGPEPSRSPAEKEALSPPAQTVSSSTTQAAFDSEPAPSSPTGGSAKGAPPPATSGTTSAESTGGRRLAAGGGASSLETESALLQRAQAALQTSPSSALSLAEEHLTRYPNGRLSEEREVITIAALVALGRSTEAEARASAYIASRPRSAYRPRIEALVPQLRAP